MGAPLDHLTRIINVHWGGGVYVVITGAGNDYAVASKDGVTVLETQQGYGPQSSQMTGTLIECPTSAGEFATLGSTLVGGPGGESGGEGSTLIAVMVYPKTEQVRELWWQYARAYQGVESSESNEGPFRWIAQFRAYNPCAVDFNIRSAPHLIGPVAEGVQDTIVEAYPISGGHTGLGGSSESITVSGFVIPKYRTDNNGEGPIYNTPPEWKVATVDSAFTLPGSRGLLFGTDPPLIAEDIAATATAALEMP